MNGSHGVEVCLRFHKDYASRALNHRAGTEHEFSRRSESHRYDCRPIGQVEAFRSDVEHDPVIEGKDQPAARLELASGFVLDQHRELLGWG